MWIDIHAHLSSLTDPELLQAADDARKESVGFILNTATDLHSATSILHQCTLSPMLRGTAGISPFDVLERHENWEKELIAICADPRIIAIGEIGIDATNPRYPALDAQLQFFTEQLRIARECNKPAIIHSRGIERKAVEICRNSGMSKVLFHCFTGGYEDLREVLDSGYYVSFSGIITFQKNAVRNLVRHVPLDRLFIETDSPYLAPVPFRGKRNTPAFVRFVGEEVLRLTGYDREKLQDALLLNVKQLFSIDITAFR